jgi:hypothetical protein
MSDSFCEGCLGKITQQKAREQTIIDIAKRKAGEQGSFISLYRNGEGELCIVPDDGQQYPICMQVTPVVQGDHS